MRLKKCPKKLIISLKQLKDPHISLIYIFGSEAKGTAHKESDVDIGVLFEENTKTKEYLQLEGMLIDFFSEIYPQREINVVNLNISTPLLKQAVVLEGNLLYKKSDYEAVIFQMQTLREYEEYLHLSNIYNRFLTIKLKKYDRNIRKTI